MKFRKSFRLLIVLALMMAAFGVLPVSADTEVLFDEAAARAECLVDYPANSGADPLSPCQWDMEVIHATAAHDTATGDGVTVGVIDGGVDFNHPDLAGGIDVDR